jgi:hypothetical protein
VSQPQARDLIMGRLDKSLSREALTVAGILYSLLEASAPPEIMALFGGVAMLAIVAVKAARCQNAKTPQPKSRGFAFGVLGWATVRQVRRHG